MTPGDRVLSWESFSGGWQIEDDPRRRCSVTRCPRLAVAKLDRPRFRYATRTHVHAWWHYCAEHLAEYSRHVEGDEIVFDRSDG